jgi:hypothetical protein
MEDISFRQAFELTISSIQPLSARRVAFKSDSISPACDSRTADFGRKQGLFASVYECRSWRIRQRTEGLDPVHLRHNIKVWQGSCFYPLKTASRLEMMARAEGIMSIPKGKEYLMEGEGVNVQLPAVIKI